MSHNGGIVCNSPLKVFRNLEAVFFCAVRRAVVSGFVFGRAADFFIKKHLTMDLLFFIGGVTRGKP
jgi:hypothetical protein